MKQLRILTAPGLGIVALTLGVFGLTDAPTVAWASDPHVWPVAGPVVRAFDPPDIVYGAGHRGIDIGAPAGTTVVAAADGIVSFVGVIDYVPMITVTHADGIRTTYQPVAALVGRGQSVTGGQAIGVLQSGHGATPCLHFGVLRGQDYLDPLAWLGVGRVPVRLLPAEAKLPPRVAADLVAAARGWPVAGRVTSGYGMRYHPILLTPRMHNGIDIAASCGTPVASPWAGVVIAVATSPMNGNFVRVAHDGGLVTSYLHLSAFSVRVGDHVVARQQIGLVGTTGLSTGCHLHFATKRNGASVDPMSVLP